MPSKDVASSKKAQRSNSFDFSIKVVDAFVGKRPTYVDIPTDLIKDAPHPKGQWFDYSTKNYYPIGVHDKRGNIVHNKGLQLQLVVSYENSNYEPIASAEGIPIKADKSGVYWFAEVKAHVYGEILLKFAAINSAKVGISCAELNVKIPIIVDAEGNVDPDIDVVGKKGGKKGGKKKRAESIVEEEEEEKEEEAPTSPKKKVKKDSKGSKGKSGDAVFKPDIILPEPVVAPVSARHRLLRWPFGEDEGKNTKIVITGAVLSLTLPQSLALAVFDDQARVKTERMKAEENPRWVEKEDPNFLMYNRPTANQLFEKLSNRMSHVMEAPEIVKQLRSMFEYCFEDWVLYAEEKFLLEKKLAKLKADKVKFADAFGPYYLLRFLIFYTTMADSFSDGAAVTGVGSSAARGLDRSFKSLFAKAQEVLNNAIKDLDDGAPKYFA